jgi:tetratricopeptide (TPR) repeat protein
MKRFFKNWLFVFVCFYFLTGGISLFSKVVIPKEQEVNAVLVQANGANAQGIKNFNDGRYSLALNSFDSALKGYERIDHQEGLIAVLQSMGLVYFAMGQDTNALYLFEESLRRSDLLGYPKGRADSFHKLGLVHLERAEFDDAIKLFQKALAIYAPLQNKEESASTYNSLALCLMSRNKGNDLKMAEDLLVSASKINQSLNHFSAMSANYLNLAQIALRQKDYKKALGFANLSLDIDKPLEDAKAIGATLNILAVIHEKLGNKKLSFFYHERAYGTSKALDLRNRQIGDLDELIRLANELGYKDKKELFEKEKIKLLPALFQNKTSGQEN